ncbi:MAG: extracellular solute-binding protein [Patescibacteria group bacterium]
MKKKKIIFVILLLMVAQLAVSCGRPTGPAKQPVALVIWKPFEESETWRSIFEEYTRTHSYVNFVYERKDIATYEDELLNALASGTGPDIFSIHNDWLASYKDKMSPAPKGVFSVREFEDAFVDVARADLYDQENNLYAVPMSVDTLALFYNRDLLGSAGIAQPPRTWAEAIEAVKSLTRQDKFGNFLVNGIAMGTDKNVNRSVDILGLLMLQNGTQVYSSAKNQATMDREVVAADGSRYNAGAQALEFYTQFANPAKETYTWNNRNNYSVDAFIAGQTAMMLSYSYMVPVVANKAPLLNFGVAAVPQVDLSKPKVNFSNYFAEGVSKASKNTEEAWNFLKFATSKESLTKYYAAHKQPASRKDIISTQIGDPGVGVFAESALTAKPLFKPNSSKFDRMFSDMIEDVILRGKSPDQAVGTGNQALTQMLLGR